MKINKPIVKPTRPFFSAGPCVKYPGWSLNDLNSALIGRSHRSKAGFDRIREALAKTRNILNIPKDYMLAITPGSTTGAMEMAIWNLIGERNIEILAWDVFGKLWVQCLQDQLNISKFKLSDAAVGYIPDLKQVDFSADIIFTWNGSTAGVCVPDGQWIPETRQGLTFCDATSAAFAYHLPWEKLDATVFSWQKALGGEAGHGMLVLSPRAWQRLEEYTPSWPIPLLYRLKTNNKINLPFFDGATLNTPSMLCVEDFIKALNWAENVGGLSELVKRSQNNKSIIDNWLKERNWIINLSPDISTQSHTTACLAISEEKFRLLNIDTQWSIIEQIVKLLEQENAALDIKNHRYSLPSFRLWCGPTVDSKDIETALPWIEWGYNTVIST